MDKKSSRHRAAAVAAFGLLMLPGLCRADGAPPPMGAELANPPEWVEGETLTFTPGNVAMPGYVGPSGQVGPVTVATRYFNTPSNALLVGPTLRVSPAQTLALPLNNSLTYSAGQGDDPSGHIAMDDAPFADTLPHGFDVVNLHTHGLHVSPKDHSDNVLLNLFPADAPDHTVKHCEEQVMDDPVTKHVCAKGTWPMSITLPAQHPSGTYWYHTHKHGAVALQLASGLAGALIVKDPVQGLESLTPVAQAIANGEEKVMVIQNIAFATPIPASPTAAPVDCATVYGTACRYPVNSNPPTGNGQLSVNGQFNPVITLQTGEAQLWRMVNTTPAAVLPICLSQVVQNPTPPAVPAPALYVLAADGVPVQIANSSSPTPFQLQQAPSYKVVGNGQGLANNEFQFLAPGQRLDLMVKGRQQGLFVLLSATASKMTDLCPATVTAAALGANNANVVAFVKVVPPTGGNGINSQVPTQAQLNALYNPAPVASAPDMPKGPTQGVTFGFTNASYSLIDKKTGVSKIGGASVVNGRPFYEGRVQRRLQLNQADLWGVQSATDTHMFHIHTNPFQLLKRGDVLYPFPIWRDTALINCADVASNGDNCAFPAGLTENVHNVIDKKNPANSSYKYGEVLQFASRAVDFTGAIVMHCHNTEHEDNGMMELVEIVEKK